MESFLMVGAGPGRKVAPCVGDLSCTPLADARELPEAGELASRAWCHEEATTLTGDLVWGSPGLCDDHVLFVEKYGKGSGNLNVFVYSDAASAASTDGLSLYQKLSFATLQLHFPP